MAMTVCKLRRVELAGVLLACILLIGLCAPARAISISSDLSASALRVTDTLTLRIVAEWAGSEGLYHFRTPRPVANPHLRLSGQRVGGSSQLDDGAFQSMKSWTFSFVCVEAGTTLVVPPTVIYTNTETDLADSVAGYPMPLTVGSAPPPPFDYKQAGLYLLAFLVVVVVGYLIGRLVVRRQRARRLAAAQRSPEEIAADLLADLEEQKREDRSAQFYTDLEKIILGLWEARLGEGLAGKTPEEAVRVLEQNGVSAEEIEHLQAVLTECHNVRFGGGQVDIQTMDKSLQTVGNWLKPGAGSPGI